MQYANQRDFIKALEEQLHDLYRQFAGAHCRIAFVRESGWKFLTGCVSFQPEYTPQRESQNYDSLLLIEEWVPEQIAASGRLAQLLHGQGSIGGCAISHTFTRTIGEHLTYPRGDGWQGWKYSSYVDNKPEIYLAQSPLLAYGLPPYLGASGAVMRWIFGAETSSPAAPQAQYQGELITIVPDTRARIVVAEWLPGLVKVNVSLGMRPEHLEIQFLFDDAKPDYKLQQVVDGENVVEVPPETSAVNIFIVHESNECVAQVRLDSLYQRHGPAAESATLLRQCAADLSEGETDHVEYKPFIERNNPKEDQMIQTIIAFANANGGRLYVGVNDDGLPEGARVAERVWKCNLETAIDLQINRIKELTREKIKPIPSVNISAIEAHGEQLVLVEVPLGQRRPYSTHDNKVYVRKGATNRLADPHSELPAMRVSQGLISQGVPYSLLPGEY